MTTESAPTAMFRTVLWALAQNWGGRAITFLLFLVLARILTPADFGLAAASALILLLITQTAELGFGDALVQRTTLSHTDVNLPFYASLLIATLLSLLVVLYSSTIESVLHLPGLSTVLSVAVLSAPLSTSMLFQEAIFRRNLEYRVLATRTIVANTLAGLISVAAAMAGLGVWSLVLQAYLATLLGNYWLWRRALWLPSGSFNPKSTRDLATYGSSVLLTRWLDFASTRALDFTIAVSYGTTALGMYTAGSRIYLTLLQLLQSAVSDVALSWVSRFSDDRPRLAASYMRTFSFSALIASPMFLMLAIGSPEVTHLLLGPKWTDVDRIARPLLLVGAIQCVQFLNAVFLGAVGRPSLVAGLNVLKLAAVSATLPYIKDGGLEVLVVGYSLCQLVTTPFSFGFIIMVIGVPSSRVLPAMLRISACLCLSYLIVCWAMAQPSANNLNDIMRLILIFAIFGGTYLLALATFARKDVRFAAQLVAKKWKRPQ